ncbi:MAG: hypothetical protein R3F49_05860 [Planctomycetota bacterium]
MVARVHSALRALFDEHIRDGGSKVEVATTWSSWTQALITSAGDPGASEAGVARDLALLDVAVDLGLADPQPIVIPKTATEALQGALRPTVQGLGASKATQTEAALARRLGPLRAVTRRAPDWARPTLADVAGAALGEAVQHERAEAVQALLDGQLAALHPALVSVFHDALPESAGAIEMFRRHAAALGITDAPPAVRRALLSQALQQRDWDGALHAVAGLAERDGLTPALRATVESNLDGAVPDALRDGSDSERAGLARFLAALTPKILSRDDLAQRLREALRARIARSVEAGQERQLGPLAARAVQLGLSRDAALEVASEGLVDAPDGSSGDAQEGALLRRYQVLLAFAADASGPERQALEARLDETLDEAARKDERWPASYAALAAEGGQMDRFIRAFRLVPFLDGDKVNGDALDLYFRYEGALESKLTDAQRAALEGAAAEPIARRRTKVALAMGDERRALQLLSAATDQPAASNTISEEAWTYVTELIAAPDASDATLARAAAFAAQVRHLGFPPPSATERVARARVLQAIGNGPAALSRAVDLALQLGAPTRDALAAAAADELRQRTLTPEAAWAQLEVLQRELVQPWSSLDGAAEQVLNEALVRGSDQLVDVLARKVDLAGPAARAFDRWFRERVFTGAEVVRGLRFAQRGAAAYGASLPRSLVADGRLANAARAELAKRPGDTPLVELVIESGAAIGVGDAERLQLSRGLLSETSAETPDLTARVLRHLALPGAQVDEPVVLRARLMAAVSDRNWDIAVPLLDAARGAGALYERDSPLIAAVQAELARRSAEDNRYRSVQLIGSWNVALYINDQLSAAVTRAEVSAVKEGATVFLQTKFSGASGVVATSFTTLYNANTRQLTVKFQGTVKLAPELSRADRYMGKLDLVPQQAPTDGRERDFVWTLEGATDAPRVKMRWTR